MMKNDLAYQKVSQYTSDRIILFFTKSEHSNQAAPR